MEDGVSKYARKQVVWGIVVLALYFGVLEREAYGLKESTGPGGSNAIAVHLLGETGEEVNVGLILARNVRTTHNAFKDSNGLSHAFNYDFTGDGISILDHDTQLAGVITSRGDINHPSYIGVAPGADIYCGRIADNSDGISWADLDDALNEFINNQNCRVIVTGFELTGLDPDGDSPWTMLYDYYAYQYGAVFANAAGNENTDVNVFGDAYNGITTGGLRLNDPNDQNEYRRTGSISGSGPTADGRRKPDITAPSEKQTVPNAYSDVAWITIGTTWGETSYSAPQMAGAAALLLGLADKTPGPNDNQSEVIKAALVNSAFPNVNNKAGAGTNPADSNNTWNPDRGYGRLDVLRAYQTLDTNEVEPDIDIVQEKGWGYGQLTQGQTDIYTITVAARCRLIATLTWQRRIEWVDKRSGFPPKYNGIIDSDELTAYLADLDMNVYAPNEPNAIFNKTLFDYNQNDNLVKCDLLILTPGVYTVAIENNSTNGETANYGWAFELHTIMAGDINNVDYATDMNDLESLMQDWLGQDSEFDLLLTPNGIIDFADFAKLAQSWLQTDPAYYKGP
jgi:hypothetical protein